MDVNITEEQQVEQIKTWWKENGKAVILGAVIGLGGLWGWRYYQGEVQAGKEQASEAYTQVITSLESNPENSVALVQGFIAEHENSQYSVLAALQLAKSLVEQQQLDAAAEQLKWAMTHTQDAAILPIARTRLARVQAQLTQYDAALAELDKVTAESWQAKVAELRGDILLEKGDTLAAREAYVQSQQLGASPALQIKLDDLAQ